MTLNGRNRHVSIGGQSKIIVSSVSQIGIKLTHMNSLDQKKDFVSHLLQIDVT